MRCQMPVVSLPNDLIKELGNSESATIDGTQGPGVATYLTSDGTTCADIYIGFKLDGYNLYQDISSFNPNIKMQFSLQPVVMCQTKVLTFNPDKDYAITIQVDGLVSNSCRCI